MNLLLPEQHQIKLNICLQIWAYVAQWENNSTVSRDDMHQELQAGYKHHDMLIKYMWAKADKKTNHSKHMKQHQANNMIWYTNDKQMRHNKLYLQVEVMQIDVNVN